jgi:hypothetical protein
MSDNKPFVAPATAMIERIRAEEDAKRKGFLKKSREVMPGIPRVQSSTGVEHAQIEEPQGVEYVDLGNGAYCQKPSTFTAKRFNRKSVLPRQAMPSDDWDIFGT